MAHVAHHTSTATVRHGRADERTQGVRADDVGWTFVEIAFIVVIVLFLAAVSVWAVVTLRDGSALAERIGRQPAASTVEGATSW